MGENNVHVTDPNSCPCVGGRGAPCPTCDKRQSDGTVPEKKK